MTYHYFEIPHGEFSANVIQALLDLAKSEHLWATTEHGLNSALVTVEIVTDDQAQMFDVLFGACEKY